MQAWFDHRHYVPILKGKRAEFPALGDLRSKDTLTPLIEAIPSQPATFVPAKMAACWPSGKPYFLDLLFLDDEDMEEKDAANHLIHPCFQDAQRRGEVAVPVTGTGRSPAYQAALRTIVASQGNGFAIRLVPEDLDDPDELEEVLDALVEYVGVEREEVDLIVDNGSSYGQPAGTLLRVHRANLVALPYIGDWRTLTLASGAFPTGLGGLVAGWNRQARVDWTSWQRLVTGAGRTPRLPAFGDYAIAHPALPPEGRATILGQLRYTIPDEFMIWKGTNAIRQGFGQFITICQSMVTQPEFCGAAFSWGDAEIEAKATTGGSPGNAETWRRIGTNHHLEMVMDQISSLPVP